MWVLLQNLVKVYLPGSGPLPAEEGDPELRERVRNERSRCPLVASNIFTHTWNNATRVIRILASRPKTPMSFLRRGRPLPELVPKSPPRNCNNNTDQGVG